MADDAAGVRVLDSAGKAFAAKSSAIAGDDYTITIRNNTVSSKTYTLAVKPPAITPSTTKVRAHVVRVATGVPNDGGVVRFQIPQRLYAMCGYTDGPAELEIVDGKPSAAPKTLVEVVSKTPVTIGGRLKDGTVTASSDLTVSFNEGTLKFTSSATSTSAENLGSFSIRTGGGFTTEQAENSHFILGLCSGNIGDAEGFFSTWPLLPNTTYEIRPFEAFHILTKDLKPRAIVSDSDLKSAQSTLVEFKNTDLTSVSYIHSQDGNLDLLPKPRL